jgi:hypothetical protein
MTSNNLRTYRKPFVVWGHFSKHKFPLQLGVRRQVWDGYMEDLVNYAVKDHTNVSITNSRNLDSQSREVLCGC